MHCEQAEMLLPQLVFDELDDASRAELMEHLSTCSACSEKLGDLRLTVNLLRQGVASRPPVLSEARRTALLKQLAEAPAEVRATEPAASAALASLAAAADLAAPQVVAGEGFSSQGAVAAPLKLKANPDRVNPAGSIDGPIPIWNWIRRHQRGLAIAAASVSIAVISWQTFSSVFQGSIRRSIAMFGADADYGGYKDKAPSTNAPVKGYDDSSSKWARTSDDFERQAGATPDESAASFGYRSGSNAINGIATDPQSRPESLSLRYGNNAATEPGVELNRNAPKDRYTNDQLATADDAPRQLERRFDKPRLLVNDGEATPGNKAGVVIDAVEPLAQEGRRMAEGIEQRPNVIALHSRNLHVEKFTSPDGGSQDKRGFGTTNTPAPPPFRNDTFYSHRPTAPTAGPVPTAPSTPPSTPVVAGKPVTAFDREESAPQPRTNAPADLSQHSGLALTDGAKTLGGKQSGQGKDASGFVARPDGYIAGGDVKSAEVKSKVSAPTVLPIVPNPGEPPAKSERGERDELFLAARVQLPPEPKLPALETPAPQEQGVSGRTHGSVALQRESGDKSAGVGGGGAGAPGTQPWDTTRPSTGPGIPAPVPAKPAGPQQPFSESDGVALLEDEKKLEELKAHTRDLVERKEVPKEEFKAIKDMKQSEPPDASDGWAGRDTAWKGKENARSADDAKPGSSAGDALAVGGAKTPQANTWFDRSVDFDSDGTAKGDKSEKSYWSFQQQAGEKAQAAEDHARNGEARSKARTSTALGVELNLPQEQALREKLDDKAQDSLGDRPVTGAAAEPELLRRAHLDITGTLPSNETTRAALGRDGKGEGKEAKDSTSADRSTLFGDKNAATTLFSERAESEQATREERIEQIATLVQDTVGKQADWAAYGGEVSSLRELDGKLIIKGTVEQHRQVDRTLNLLRGKRVAGAGVGPEYAGDSSDDQKTAAKLQQRVDVNFEGKKLNEAIDFLKDKTGTNVVTNWAALEAAGIEQDLPVTLKLKDVPADIALKLMLQQAGSSTQLEPLNFNVREGIVRLSTERDLSRTTDTRVYDVRDILGQQGVIQADALKKQIDEDERVKKDKLEADARVALLAAQQAEASAAAQRPQAASEDAAELMPAASFKVVPVNPWTLAQEDNQSTFGLDVDTASYSLARRYLKKGYLPPVGSVRMEEFVNAFDYNYPTRDQGVFTVHTEAAPAPFASDSAGNTVLLKVGVKGKVIGRDGRKPANLVLVVDASGSMSRADRLPLVQHSLTLLVSQLNPSDTVSLVAFGSQVHTLLQTTPAAQKSKIIEAIASIQPTGQTNLLKGLQAGYQLAEQAHKAGAINRVILCSDGIATVGESEAESILSYVDRYRQQGISCTTVGFGAGAYDDNMMEKLANKGDGAYYFVDSQREARRVFVDELTATLQTIAKDAKIQVEFNPAKVRRYRLIGYENRAIADKDFRNDKIDAGEVGSGQSSTALYELELAEPAQPADQQARAVQAAQGAGAAAPAANVAGPQAMQASDLGIVYVRYRNTDTDKIEEIAHHVDSGAVKRCTPVDAPRFFLAACAAEFAELLRQSEHAQGGSLQQLVNTLDRVVAQLPLDEKAAELLDLVRKAQGLPRAP